MNGILYVVETDTDLFVGTLEFVDGGVIVRSGFAGHPKHVVAEDINIMMPAHLHPAVEGDEFNAALYTSVMAL